LELALKPLPLDFYRRDALVLARALIGSFLVKSGKVARIVETEAYRGPRDLACHARFGETKRTRALLGPPGHAYVFLVYGMHECFNVVGNEKGCGHAVLVRAVEPIGAGAWSGSDTIDACAAGPGLVTRAMKITRADDGVDLTRGDLFIAARAKRPARIAITARVGVAYAKHWADKPYRFYDASSPCVSRPSKSAIGRPM
jgi:DNA-3-methyladenine glycosylase